MTTALDIAPIAASDREDWQRLWTAYLEFYEATVSPQVYDTTFARLIDSKVSAQCGLIARKDGVAVGLVHYIFHPHNWRVEDVCYLQDLFVDPDIRRTGAGRALIEAVYAAADARGTSSVYWMTQEFNSSARKLYDQVASLTPFVKYQR